MKSKDLAALLTAVALLLGTLGTFAKQISDLGKDQAATYQNTALQMGEDANEVGELRARIAALEAAQGGTR